jgi:hypothetical protein
MTTETEREFVQSARGRARDRAVEDAILKTLLDYELDGYNPHTRTIIGLACDAALGWLHMVPGGGHGEPSSSLRRLLFIGRMLQGLNERRLVRRAADFGEASDCWELTDDGRHEARKLREAGQT